MTDVSNAANVMASLRDALVAGPMKKGNAVE